MEDYATKNFKHKPDFAITNGGGIRASISKGKVTKYDIISVLPFGNLISQIKVKGSDVKKAFEHSLSAPTETKNGRNNSHQTAVSYRFLNPYAFIMISIKNLVQE